MYGNLIITQVVEVLKESLKSHIKSNILLTTFMKTPKPDFDE